MSDYPKIVVTPPGPKARELAMRDEKVISQSFVRFYPLAIQSGRGCIIRDVDGNEYIDFNSGLVCLNVGHSHPKVVEAIKSQLDRFLHYSVTDFLYREVVDVAEKLLRLGRSLRGGTRGSSCTSLS
jgi:4-aminobutyrate aminotransferase